VPVLDYLAAGVGWMLLLHAATHISPAHGAPAAPRLQRVPPPAIYSSAVLAGRPSGAPAAMIRPAPDTYQAVSNVASLQLPTSAAAAAVPLHVHGSIRPVLGAGRGIPPKGAQPPHQQGLQLDAQSSAMYYVHHPMQQVRKSAAVHLAATQGGGDAGDCSLNSA
jgi:hypothetical protein